MEEDVGKIFIHNVEAVLPVWMGLSATMCIYTQDCGGCLILEHNGDIYSCDHFMYPQYKLGNILHDAPWKLVQSEEQRQFGMQKGNYSLKCQMCDVRIVCGGGCPKHRFVLRDGGTVPTHYLCEGYELFYRHIDKYMRAIVQLIQHGRLASEVMDLAKGSVILLKSGELKN